MQSLRVPAVPSRLSLACQLPLLPSGRAAAHPAPAPQISAKEGESRPGRDSGDFSSNAGGNTGSAPVFGQRIRLCAELRYRLPGLAVETFATWDGSRSRRSTAAASAPDHKAGKNWSASKRTACRFGRRQLESRAVSAVRALVFPERVPDRTFLATSALLVPNHIEGCRGM